ncbi:type III-B CRISPR module RAMP protein Cmr1 [Anoxybacillus flavithermus]|uniref:type III-B CRISPR module RAMP protein Cmr1 n=1 Tax=Anoxybacillus flavithermus TaxID=33934 RepID=UPI001868B178|nr:type III-B CRISPR module RAMP protein Cmr1 [Anoxybacillus flavithermus]MBE2925996.1 type III-B CRISPR module RAMP protein Cmr1 [Anoxybacillus flavithermus]MBE2936345.1 type III-B CRISPR module RAMP protein Cmr1 [Anoxybacillus flavithermus]MBE2944565.1 type III-B CRISPR module RAMP protein Cmr1 [Anoxybacillus flavithermus]MBE2949311.1 type III-B CRISPR module RAMP protein Cmr1 [Anoxybacillus flavithermus]
MNHSAICKRSYDMELITPLAMHGANPKQQAEFRIASWRGVLRYWWRTLQEENNNETLLKKEETLFGGTMINKQKSPVAFVLEKKMVSAKKENVLPHKQGTAVPAIPSGCSVTITMQARNRHEQLVHTYDLYVQYMLHLAGMGQRARRGFGAMQWAEHQWESVAQFSHSLQQILQQLRVSDAFTFSHEGCVVKRKRDVKTSYPVLSAVWVGKGEKSPQSILVKFGKASHEANGRGDLGRVRPKKWASPLWCTVRKMGDLYYPIITEVKVNDERYTNKNYERQRDEFLKIVGVKL